MLFTQPAVVMLVIIILGLLVWAASLSIRLKNATDKATAAVSKRDYSESILERHLKESRCNIETMQAQLRNKENELRDAMRMMNHKATLKCITFTTRTSGLTRFATGHNIASIDFQRKVDRFVVTIRHKNGTSRVVDYNHADITGPITLERGD